MAKAAEKRVVAMAKYYDWYRHKYGDVRYCIHCHLPLPKTENAPDYAIAPVFTWIEAKNNDSNWRWIWSEISEGGPRGNQRAWLIKNGGWLFIELLEERESGSPWAKHRGAFLIPFKSWIKEVEPILIEKNMKSIRLRQVQKSRPGAETILAKWALEWKPNVGWIIPNGHIWWVSLRSKTLTLLEHIGDKWIQPSKETK